MMALGRALAELAATPPRKSIVYDEAFRRDSVAACTQSGQSVPKYAAQIEVHRDDVVCFGFATAPMGAARKHPPMSIRCKPKTANSAPSASGCVRNATF
jgi:hypothetical protein